MHQTFTRLSDYAASWVARLDAFERALNQTDARMLRYRAAKLTIPILLCGIAGGAITLLWHMPLALTVTFLILALLKHKLFPLRYEWFAFTVIAFLGAYAESGIIHASGAWAYAESQIANIPLWLPPLWGLVGISLITGYVALIEPARRVQVDATEDK